MFNINIKFKSNFNIITKNKKIISVKKKFNNLKNDYLQNKIPLLSSFEKNSKLNYKKNLIKRFKNNNQVNVIGMGGSVLGAKSIYSFLKHKIKKNFYFIDDLNENNLKIINNNSKKKTNIYISKSGNTIETLVNLNLISNKNKSASNIFITEIKKNNLLEISKKLKSEIVEHKNYIGGRYSVMSEVGMLPAELMGLNVNDFKQLNYLILNKNFINNLILNVSSIYNLYRKKKLNSIILNYDPGMYNFCLWYQQLVAESLGKKNKGILPIISNMPKDNHSLLQYYLDGPKNSFFTIFISKHLKNFKLDNSLLPTNMKYLSGQNLESITNAQRKATENIFSKKKISYRTFHILKKTEKELGFMFTFFVLETILLSKMLQVNPFDQPSVELVKKSTRDILSNN